MGPFNSIIFMIFHLPVMMGREALSMFSEFYAGIDKKKFYWRLPYYLIAILSLIAIVLWFKGYR